MLECGSMSRDRNIITWIYFNPQRCIFILLKCPSAPLCLICMQQQRSREHVAGLALPGTERRSASRPNLAASVAWVACASVGSSVCDTVRTDGRTDRGRGKRDTAEKKERRRRGEQVKTVDGCCPAWGDSTFFTDEEKKDFKIESKDRNSPSGKSFHLFWISFSRLSGVSAFHTGRQDFEGCSVRLHCLTKNFFTSRRHSHKVTSTDWGWMIGCLCKVQQLIHSRLPVQPTCN